MPTVGFIDLYEVLEPDWRVTFFELLDPCNVCLDLSRVHCGDESILIGCPTSGVAQRAMKEAAPHARCVSKAR
jgi:hypothetical protein